MLKKYTDFRVLWSGRLISNIGDSIYSIVLSWFILEQTKSPLWVGILNAAIFLPNLLSFLFGPLIDAKGKKQLLILAEIGQLVPILIIGVMIGTKFNNAYLTCGLVFIASLFGMNVYTIQDAFVPMLVKEQDLPAAQTYLSFAYDGTEYLFNGIAGILLNVMSYFSLIMLDVVSFIISILTFSRIKDPGTVAVAAEDASEEEMVTPTKVWDGFKIIKSNSVLLTLTIFSLVINVLFGGINVYQILIAKALGNASYLGLLAALGALGTLIGSSLVANLLFRKLKAGTLTIVSHAFIALAFGLSALLYDHSWLFFACWFLGFCGLGVTRVVQTPIFQKLVPVAKMGTTMGAFYTLSVVPLPIGSLVFGWLGNKMSSATFLYVFALGFLLASLGYFLNKNMRKLSFD
ncbi:MFS transporter [Lapidilactobacillus luobeiensis]|uniref:MFS transporter n=1 Tax=Lapidilactobacillus luobeiensis TaxID=2950371 RepID=UPI0021C39A8D|nr:MFS transporter [Lapidilactobacillus luobeiensis]